MTITPTMFNEAADAALSEVLLSPEGRTDPYSRYHRLREAAPVHHSAMGLWVLSRYDDVNQVLRDKEVGKDPELFMDGRFGGGWAEHASLRRMSTSMLWANPPTHTRLRRIIARAFTPRRIDAMRPVIESLFDEFIEPLAAAGGGDILNDVFYDIPLQVICAMLGVPREEAPPLRAPMNHFQRTFELGLTSEELLEADAGAEFSDEYFDGLVARRRAEPQDDLLSDLVQMEDEEGRLSHAELIGFCNMVVGAGFETATHLLSNAVYALLRHPEQMELLRKDPSLIPGAVEEVLRWDPPVHLVIRMTSQPLIVAGQEIPPRSTVITLLAAANRDPEKFPDPDRFDVRRDDHQPISFSAGIHHCLGWALAKLEAEVVLDRLLRRFPVLRLDGSPEYRPRLTLRGLETLHVHTDQEAPR
ncbi:cytochrome P450 [Micromonospora arborensis]|uniref:cytochrome P450 n=1 Tax=Micromonospora arborensis TaxID=2116518 RepID=UPI003417095F